MPPVPPRGRRAGGKTKVKDLSMPADLIGRATPKVRELTVSDLEDLARKFDGVAVENREIEGLRAEDIRSLEEVFQGAKTQLAQEGAFGPEGDLEAEIFDNWRCCCCTPCCCCAAADVDPFADGHEAAA